MNDGGPAFPAWEDFPSAGGGFVWKQKSPGMTMRDYFAAQSIPELIHYCSENRGENWHEATAQMAYKVADAMLREREKQP